MSTNAAAPEWRPTPKFVLRNGCIEAVIADWQPGRFLEVGAGTGTITRTFLDRGYQGVCHDVVQESRDVLRVNLASYGAAARVVDDLETLEEASFDYVFAFEVLEHIPEDLPALVDWTRWLRPGGRLLVSVPAHQRKYGPVDASVGHVRRYERPQLRRLLLDAGFRDVEILNYGFPLGNITRLAQRVVDEVRGADDDPRSYSERSIDSGVRSSRGALRIAPLVTRRTLAPFLALQRPLFHRELGDGFVASGVKPD
jgi:SAM-dependent methyltransferase